MDETYEYRLLRTVLETARRYALDELDAEGAARNLWGIGEALEGDVPKEVRDAVFHAAADSEGAWFGSRDREDVLGTLEDVRTTIIKYYPLLDTPKIL